MIVNNNQKANRLVTNLRIIQAFYFAGRFLYCRLCLTLSKEFYQARSGIVMQKCRSRKKEEKVTYGFGLVVASLFVLFWTFFSNYDDFYRL